MTKTQAACGLAALALTLAGCGGESGGTSTQEAAQQSAQPALPADETTTDTAMQATNQGAGDTTSSMGAGALTGAVDGGAAGDDGLPAGDEGRGGPADHAGGPGSGTDQ